MHRARSSCAGHSTRPSVLLPSARVMLPGIDMSSAFHRLALIGCLTTLPLAACPSGGGQAEPVHPPVLLSGARPQFRYPERPAAGRVLDIQIEVSVDPTGHPDANTLRVTGLG